LDDGCHRAVLQAQRLGWLVHQERELELPVSVKHAAEQTPGMLPGAANDSDRKRFPGGAFDRSDEDFDDHVLSSRTAFQVRAVCRDIDRREPLNGTSTRPDHPERDGEGDKRASQDRNVLITQLWNGRR
jgi:hypothetical protein